jgi:trk system potassium uptake protein TrkA
MKEFAVIGLGNFGATVARELARLKCKVTAIDSNKALVQSLQGSVHMAIVANATEREFLENLEVDKFDAFVVSTGEDTDASILIALYLKELGAQKIIVKAKTEDHAKILLKVGASQAMIPEKQMATRIAHSLSETNLVDYLPLSEEYFVAEVPPPRKFIDKTLIDLKIRSKYHIQVIAVKNVQTGALKFVPGADYQIQSSDILVVLGRGEDIEKLK